MKDAMKPCQHSLSDDAVYKEVVVIGNGPSGMVTSFMLAGNVPRLRPLPSDAVIDEMLAARLSNLLPGTSLYETDLMELAEGLEGRSHNPTALLMDILLRPGADLGMQADPLIEWEFDIDKQIEHVVLGRGPPGGSWQSFPSQVRTLSPASWLSLPPHAGSVAAHCGRVSARAVAEYCERYVAQNNIQRYFRCGVVVTGVSLLPTSGAGPPCSPGCPRNAIYCVTGYDQTLSTSFRYVCRRVILACGAGDCPNTLRAEVAQYGLHSLAEVERAVNELAAKKDSTPSPLVLVVGSGVSAADAVRLASRSALRVAHVHKTPAEALARLEPAAYPDYYKIYRMMCDGPSANHPNYTPYPEHIIADVNPEHTSKDYENPMIRPKRVTLINTVNNQTVELTVNLIAILIGSKPDLFFLQTNFNINSIDLNHCLKCEKYPAKRKEEKEKQCSLKTQWHYLKNVLGQSILKCASRFSAEINGNDLEKCILPDCIKREQKCILPDTKREEKFILPDIKSDKCQCLVIMKDEKDYRYEVIPYSQIETKNKCTCTNNPSSGLGFGLDPKKPVDGRSNPIAIDKTTHELINAPKGIYALGPLTADNFIRFIPGGALAIVAHIHKEKKTM